MPTLTITWHNHPELSKTGSCPTCKALNGYTWIFEAGKDMFDGTLQHYTGWVVWDVVRGSQAHGHERYNCNCTLSYEIDLEDVLAKCVYLRELAQAYSEPYIPWRGGELAV